jgi:hypothetical protein
MSRDNQCIARENDPHMSLGNWIRRQSRAQDSSLDRRGLDLVEGDVVFSPRRQICEE